MKDVMRVCDVYKIYNKGKNEVRALDGVSLSVKRGEFVAIVGSSGSGKSTLMNILGCLDAPDGGSYYLDGTDVSSLSGRRLSQIRSRKIGFVFQKFFLLPTLSAIENVELPMLYMGVSPAKRRKTAERALDMVGLSARRGHKPCELSGGQQQRVAIARAVATSPDVILADEPTGNLDSSSGEAVMELMRSLNEEGRTIVLITHDIKTAESAKRVITVRDGKIQN